MKNYKFVIILLYIFWGQNIYTQVFKAVINKSRMILKNKNDSFLVNGIYLVKPFISFKYEDLWDNREFKVEYTQTVKDIILKNKILFLKQDQKARYVYSNYRIRDIDDEWMNKYKRKYARYGRTDFLLDYLINPIPIATKENIKRIYDYKYYNEDSSIVNYGLTIKLNFVLDSLLHAEISSKEKYVFLGLVINDELVSIANYLENIPEEKSFVLSFKFYNKTRNEVQFYKKTLMPQTLKRNKN